jgi:fumarate reductase flavoprotein subunit
MTVSTSGFDADVIVLGGGACGMMTALRAARNPEISVLLFEKNTRQGCNTQYSSGSLAAGGTRFQKAAGIDDSPERHANDILSVSNDLASKDLVREVCEAAPHYVEWLADDLDYPIELGMDMVRSGQSVPRLHTDIGRRGGSRLVQYLRRAMDSADNIGFVDNTSGVGLLYDGAGPFRRVSGAVIAEPSGPQEVRSRHVVLATDGFANNTELLQRYCPDAVGAFNGGASTSTGDGIDMGLDAGAALGNMTGYLGHGMVVAGVGTRLNPNLPFLGAAMVDEFGQRFCDERAQGYSKLAGIIRRQPGGRVALIWDESAMAMARHSELMRESEAANAYKIFPSVEEMALSLGIPPANLVTTLANFKAHSDLVERSEEGLSAPWYAAWITHGILTTQGGLMIDVKGRVKRADDSVIAGLSAGGGAATGISGDSSDGYSSGNGLLAAMGLGWIIGNRLAGGLE